MSQGVGSLLTRRAREQRAPQRFAARDERAKALFFDVLDRTFTHGQLEIVSGGEARRFGSAGGRIVSIRIRDDRFFSLVLTDGNLGLAHAWMDGAFSVSGGATLSDFLTLLLQNRLDSAVGRTPSLWMRVAAERLRSTV